MSIRQVSLQEVKQLARQAYYPLWSAAQSLGRDVKIYCHWTAGRHYQIFSDYHISITGDGSVYVSTDNFSDLKSATFRRNSGSISIALCCALDAVGRNNLGPYPPTEQQHNALAQVVCVLADALNLTININRVMTHAEAADNKDGLSPHEPYGPDSTCERWDLWVAREGDPAWSGGDFIRGNANYYRGQGLLKEY